MRDKREIIKRRTMGHDDEASDQIDQLAVSIDLLMWGAEGQQSLATSQETGCSLTPQPPRPPHLLAPSPAPPLCPHVIPPAPNHLLRGQERQTGGNDGDFRAAHAAVSSWMEMGGGRWQKGRGGAFMAWISWRFREGNVFRLLEENKRNPHSSVAHTCTNVVESTILYCTWHINVGSTYVDMGG